MKFQIGRKELLEALKRVQPAVANRSTLPILGGIKLEAAGGTVTLEATDLEFAIRLEAEAESSDGHGSVVVPAKSFIKAVKAVADSSVTVEIHDEDDRKTVDVSCEKRKVTIESFSAGDWPDIAGGIDWKPVCRIEAADLANALGRVSLCASTDEARPILTGVQFNLGGGGDKAKVVATDSYRLGVASLDIEPLGEAPGSSPILPARVLKALARELDSHDGWAVMYLGTAGQADHQRVLFEFSLGSISWIMRQIEGEFPNWKALLPEDTAGSGFEYDSKELANAVKGASELRSEKATPVRLVLGDSCALRMAEGQVETTTETLEGATYHPDGVGPLEIAFNPDFLLDGISFMGNGTGLMRITAAAKPALFVGHDDSRYLLMPVRTK